MHVLSDATRGSMRHLGIQRLGSLKLALLFLGNEQTVNQNGFSLDSWLLKESPHTTAYSDHREWRE